MFKNEFQGGSYFEVFSAQAKDAIADWKQSGSGARKEFDKEVRSFVYVIEGSTATTKIHIPKDNKQSLTLIQRFLILQLCVPRGHDFSIDLSVSDHSNQKRRLVLSTAYKETKINPLHSKIPLSFIKRSKWLNLCLDMLDLVNGAWHGQTYKCIDCISIAGNCRLRRIFTMKLQPLDTTDDEELYGFPSINNGIPCDGIPKQCQLAIDIPQDVQVVTLTKVRHFEKRGHSGEPLTSRVGSQQDLDLNSSGGRKTSSQDNYHIAFGTKISGSGQPRKGSGKDRNTSSQQSKSHPSQMKSDASAESLHTSRASTENTENKDGTQFAKPHPPREPSSEKRRRPRVKSAGHDHTSSQPSKDESSSAYSSMNSSRGASQSRSNSGNKSRRGERAQTCLQQPKVVASEEEVEQIIQEMTLCQQHDYRKSETESDGSHNTSEIQDPDTVNPDLMMDVIKALNEQVLRNDEAQEYEQSEMETKDMNDEDTEALYTFASRPKGVPDKPKSGSSKFERNPLHPSKRRSRSDLPCYENASSLTTSSDENEAEASHLSTRNAGGRLKANKSKSKAENSAELKTGYSKNLIVPQTVNSSTYKSNGLLQVAPQITKSPHQSQTRYSLSRRSLREITNEDWKQSQPYNANKYQPNAVAEVTDSYEKQMLASLQRQMMESGSSSDGEKATRLHNFNNEAMVGSSDDDDDDTDRSTLKLTSQHNAHSYQDEMKILSQEFLSQSNPRDWGNVFSPPIALSSTKNNKQSDDDTSSNNELKTKEGESDGDEMLDLLYDPVLNCYYDPVSCKYYELV